MNVTRRAEAEAERKRLVAKGYPAFVEPTPDGRYRVRVGHFKDRREAEPIQRRLEKEEKFGRLWVAPS